MKDRRLTAVEKRISYGETGESTLGSLLRILLHMSVRCDDRNISVTILLLDLCVILELFACPLCIA